MKLKISGDWTIEAEAGREHVRLEVVPPPLVSVKEEACGPLPAFNASTCGWGKGYRLDGVETQETTAKGLLVPGSLQVRTEPGGAPLLRGRDYEVDEDWGTLGWLPGGPITAGQPAWATYTHGLSRIDSVVTDAGGAVLLRQGAPHAAVPLPPALAPGETRLANLWLPGRLARLTPDNLYPVLEMRFPEAPRQGPAPAAGLLPKTWGKLQRGEPLRILAWGDSVTDARYLSTPAERWQAQFARRLGARFPNARLELLTDAWGGRNTASYFAEPPGAEHNFAEKVLAAKPDLIVSEFVNDSGLKAAQVDEQYGRSLAAFRGIGAEWIILTPHYMLPEWMGLQGQREIDDDPREYVRAVRAFAAANGIALADAARRYGRLWRQGLPYMTLMLNALNHPDARGMRLFADSLMDLFG